jgi:cytochrome c553
MHVWGAGSVIALGLLVAACTTGSSSSPSAAAAAAPEQCAVCHRNDGKTWRETYHAKVARSPHEALLKEAAQYWTRDSKGNGGPSHGNVDGRTYALDDVQMVVGTRWKQRFLVKNAETGHHQFLDKQWNSYTRLWEGYANKDEWDAGCTVCHEPDGKAAPVLVQRTLRSDL